MFPLFPLMKSSGNKKHFNNQCCSRRSHCSRSKSTGASKTLAIANGNQRNFAPVADAIIVAWL